MEGCKDEYGGLAHTGSSLADDVTSVHSNRDALVLDRRGGFEAALLDGVQELRAQDKVFEVRGVGGTRSSGCPT